jgi:hypothetical protein
LPQVEKPEVASCLLKEEQTKEGMGDRILNVPLLEVTLYLTNKYKTNLPGSHENDSTKLGSSESM